MAPINTMQLPQELPRELHDDLERIAAMGEDVTVREFFGSDAAYEAATKAAQETIAQSRRSAEEVRLAEERRATLEKSQMLKLLGQRIAALRDRYAAR